MLLVAKERMVFDMENESAKQLWQNFKLQNPNVPDTYSVWAFGDSKEMADELSALVLSGLKTATCSALHGYKLENEPIPKAGDYSVILDGNGEAMGIVQNRKVTIYSFEEVPETIAYEEGEGDRTLAYWREEHEAFFKREFAEMDWEFSLSMEIVCEQFELVYAA